MSLTSARHSTDQKEHGAKGTEVFVGGLPRSISEDKIHKIEDSQIENGGRVTSDSGCTLLMPTLSGEVAFNPLAKSSELSACGEILEIRMIKDQKGNLKGFCFVRFATKEAANRAVREKSGTMIDGKKIGVLPSSEQDTLYFGNLNKAWSADEFQRIVLQVFPDIESVDLAMLKDVKPGQKQRNRGFAFVKFSSHAAASRAQRVGSQPDFRLGSLHPAVQWAEEQADTDPEELAKIKIAFVRSLPVDAEENYLKRLFERFGKVEKVVVSKKGSFPVGFVHFAERSDLERAINEMNERTVQGPSGGPTHKIQVEVARPMDRNKKRVREDSESNLFVQGNSKLIKEEPGVALANNHNSHVQQELVSADPYEDAVIALPLPVKERLLRILRLGIATRFDIDVKSLCSLKELPEFTAISVLDQFMLSAAALQNKGAYLAGLISKHLVGKVELTQSLVGLSKVADNSIKESNQLFRFSHQVSVSPPAVGSFGSHAHSTAARSDIHTSHYSSPLSDYPLPSRTLIGREEEKRPDFVLSNRTLYGSRNIHIPNIGALEQGTRSPFEATPGQELLLSNQSLPRSRSIPIPNIETLEQKTHYPFEATPGQALFLSNSTLSGSHSFQIPITATMEDRSHSLYEATQGPSITSYGRIGLRSEEQYRPPLQTAPTSSTYATRLGMGLNSGGDSQAPRPQVRFDPFTGEPYKFDPFTGEPIRPESTTRQF
ncbi:hypothetical protein BUALT_Bualt04G0137900 [Buddleja alternifolia]|uniref:RRM domain-containing protein n=1 Tax=Buddleja alternifolia TaxID=168488 RepID=A0AAV6Y010_9LAMI|nr:hypothetical protein BUALT_Bualt04G0137900 [Buddleja alternifolia]